MRTSRLTRGLSSSLACITLMMNLGACKQKKATTTPAQPTEPSKEAAKPELSAEEARLALKEQLGREALGKLRPFAFEQGRLSGQASLVNAPEVEALESGAWILVGEFTPDGATLECLIEPDLFPLGEKMGRFVQVSLKDSKSVGKYQTSVGELFLRQSKYTGLSQVLMYQVASDPSVVGFYTIVATHGDSWTLTCAADSPGYFKTMMAATTQLADSIVVTPDENTTVPQEHSIYELKLGDKRIGLQEHNLYRLADGGTMQLVEVSAVGGKPNTNFQVRSQYHLKNYQGDRLQDALVMQYVNGASVAEFTYEEDQARKSVRIKDEKRKDAPERVVSLETPLWNDAQIKACLREALSGKRKECRISSGALTEKNELAFGVSTMKVQDKKDRVFSSSATAVTGVQWFDTKLDSTRSEMRIEAQERKIPIESVRIWPRPE